jgi:hypothetical protein
MDLDQVRVGFLAAGIPAAITDELLDSYTEAKRRYYLADHRPQEVEGGRFSEAVFRALQHQCSGVATPLGKSLPRVDDLIRTLEASLTQPDSIRFHIPRTLRLIYDIRNKRDVAHLADGIDSNLQDATLVIGNMDWVMAELIRLYHGVAADDAQQIIEDLITKDVPAVQEIDGQPVILADLQPRDQALLMIYRAGAAGVSLGKLAEWLRTRKDNLKARVLRLDSEKLVLHHPRTGQVHITRNGIRDVERRGLAKPI